MITVTISSIPAEIMQENIINALSVWLSVLTSLVVALVRSVFFCVFIVVALLRSVCLCVWFKRHILACRLD